MKLLSNIDEVLIHEMSNKWQVETSLPMNIWIDESQTYKEGRHSKRIKFQLDTSDNLKPKYVGTMDLNGELHPKNLKTPELRDRDLLSPRNFVHNNKYALEMLADMKIRL